MPGSRPHLEDNEGQKSHHKRDKYPKPTSKNIIILKEPRPRVVRHIVSEAELESDCKEKPDHANGQGLCCRFERPFETEEPCVPEKEENPRQT
jgi:hypothetical protein